MNSLIEFANHHIFQHIGAGLLHFVWQGFAVAFLLAIALRLLKNASAEWRHLTCWVAFIAMATLPIITITSTATSYTPPAPYYQSAFLEQTVKSPSETPVADQAQNQVYPATTPVASGQLIRLQTYLTQALLAIQPYVALIWMLGVLVLAGRLQRGFRSTKTLRHINHAKPGEQALQLLSDLKTKMGIKKSIRIHGSAGVDQPLLIGWLKPIILLPASCLTGLPPQQLQATLAHELAHIKRHDYFFSTLQSVIETLLFFHPAVWWVSQQIRQEREHCCDDLAVATLENKKTYLLTLASLEDMRLQRHSLSLSMADGSLLKRVNRLVNQSPSRPALTGNSSTVLLGLILFISLSAGITACKQPAPIEVDQAAIQSEIQLPVELIQRITSNDIEGAITYLHDIREAGHPDALSIAYAAFERAISDEMRRNIVYVFGHFNSQEADNLLIHLAKTDEEEHIRYRALRSISMRLNESGIRKYLPNRMYADPELFTYPLISEEQLVALRQPLKEIAFDENQSHGARTIALRILSHKKNEEGLLEQLYGQTNQFELKVDILRMLNISPEEKLSRLQALYSPGLEPQMRTELMFGMAVTGLPEAGPFLIQIMRDDLKQENTNYMAGFGLSSLTRNMDRSQITSLRGLLDIDALEQEDWGIYQDDMKYFLLEIQQ